jgi:hypothetical protein
MPDETVLFEGYVTLSSATYRMVKIQIIRRDRYEPTIEIVNGDGTFSPVMDIVPADG